MDGNKIIHAGVVGFCRFFIGGLIDIGCSRVLHVQTVVLKDLADGQGQAERIVLFLAAVVDCTGIAAAVAGIQHD